jgi:alpha-L-fucosidase
MNPFPKMTQPFRNAIRHGTLALATLALAASASAALITWSSAPATVSGSYGQTLNTGLFDSTNVVYAENTGGAAQSFDGINFSAGTINFAGAYDGFHEGGWPSQTGTYGSSGPNTVTLGTGSLPALTIGQQYKIQVLVFDGRSDTGIPGRTVSLDGINQGTYASGVYNVNWGTGRLVTGTFTADATTQAFTIEAFDGATSKGGLVNALVLNAVIPRPPDPTPSAAQQAQIDRKYGMFCCFGVNTFANLEWSDGTLPATSFAPTAVDADQWVQTAKAAGMRYLLLTTKHHDGFCLWDSQWTTYDVASSAVPDVDVVKLVSEACARHGIRFAVYYSLWDRHEPSYGNAADYVTYMKRQLTELLSNYGPVAELWLDGGWERPSDDWNIPELYTVVKRLQPECQFTVNWSIGLPTNHDAHPVQPSQQENGFPIRYFPADFRTADPLLPKFPDPKAFTHNGETYYMPFEATVTTTAGNTWYFNTGDTTAKPLSVLERTFNAATAQNNLLVLNAAPNRDGVIIPACATALTQLAYRLGLEPDRPHPVNLANTATTTASSTWMIDAGYEAPKATDEDPDTRWAAAAGDPSPWLEIAFANSTRFDRVIINEYGEDDVYRCTSFNLQAWNGSSWDIIHTGTTLGESIRIDLSAPVTATKLRLQILGSTNTVSIWMLKVQDSARPNPAQTSYRLWQEQNFSLAEINAGTADSDTIAANDGVANALKFALGISDVRNPYNGTSLTPLVPREGDTPLFTFLRAQRDAGYTVQASEDLTHWNTLAIDPGSTGSTGSLVSVPVPQSSTGKSFVRLNVDPEP